MSKRIFKTIFNKKNTPFPEAEGEKIPKSPEKDASIALSYIFSKKIYGKEPTNTKVSKFSEMLIENGFNFERFDQATASRKKFLKSFEKNILEVDFLVLKEWDVLLESKPDSFPGFIESKLKKADELTIYLINLLKEPVYYCDFVQDILNQTETLTGKNHPEFITEIDEILNINFEELHKFFKGFQIKNISPEKEILEKKLFAGFNLVPLQENMNIRDILYHNWKPLKITCKGQGISLNGEMEKDFHLIMKRMPNKKNLLLISGIEGSGKSFIASYLATGAVKAGFNAGYIPVENSYDLSTLTYEAGKFFENSVLEKNILFIDGIHNLNLNKDDRFGKGSFLEFLDSYSGVENKYLVFTGNPDTDFHKKVLNKLLLEDFEVFHIEKYNGQAKWIKTIMEDTIYSESSNKTTGSFRMYFDYLYKVISFSCERYGYNFEDIFEGLAEIAFCSVKGKPKITDFDNKFRYFLENQQIASIDTYDLGSIVFRHQIFQKIFAGEYIYRHPEKVSDLWKDNKYRNEKWSLVFLYLSEKLDGAYDNYLKNNSGILIAIIHHLRKMRKLDLCETFISYAPEPEQKARETDLLMLEKAKNLYSKEGDYINCLKTLNCIGDLHQPDIFYEYIIILTCCTIDLFYPETTLKLTGEYLKSREIKNDPRVLGNMARSYLRTGNFEKAVEVFREKEKFHHKNENYSEQLRDQTDIILAEAFYYYHNQNALVFSNILEKALSLAEIFDKKSLQDEVSYDGKKVFVFRNLSYFLPFVPEAEGILPALEDFISKYDSDEKAPLGIIMVNIAFYHFNHGNFSRCKEYLYQSLNFLDTYNIEKAFVWYSIKYITGDERAYGNYRTYRDKTEKNMNFLSEHLQNKHSEKTGLFEKLEGSDKLLNLLDLMIF